MLHLGIDQHRKQLTVNIRDEQGDVVLKRQVSAGRSTGRVGDGSRRSSRAICSPATPDTTVAPRGLDQPPGR